MVHQMSALVRKPAVSGMFYPANRSELLSLVEKLLADVAPKPNGPAPKVIVAPHAGYVYSGPIAASAFKLFEPIGSTIERIVLIGPAHRVYLEGIAHAGAATFVTPLGEAEVDERAIGALSGITQNSRAHAQEHSLEVEIPFIQHIAPNAKIVPLVLGQVSPQMVGETLLSLWGGPETRIVISSDLSHYLPYSEGKAMDRHTAEHILACSGAPITGEEACGAAGINGLIWLASQKKLWGEIIDLRSSGDTAGSKKEVVGYGAFAFYEGKTNDSN